MGAAELEAFISHLASQGQAAALSSHCDALGAFLGAFFRFTHEKAQFCWLFGAPLGTNARF